MDNNNKYLSNMNEGTSYDVDINNEVFSTRYDYDDRYDPMLDRRFDPRYDRYFYDPMRYYRFPYCDRYGRCENPIRWLFWPFFFLQ